MRPPSRATPKPPDTIEDIQKTLKDLSLKTRSLSNNNGSSAFMPTFDSTSDIQLEEVSRPVIPTVADWSDDVLEEVSRLGEGAGGAVHQVKDKRSGSSWLARHLPPAGSMKQLLRELSIISSTAHPNVIPLWSLRPVTLLQRGQNPHGVLPWRQPGSCSKASCRP